MRPTLAFILLPGLAWADDVPARADVTAATVYLAGADVIRAAQADLPAGRHRLLLPLPGADAPPEVAVEGASLREVALLRDGGLDLAALDTPEQAAARDGVEAAADRTRAARRAVETARADLEAAEARLRWIGTLTGGGEGGLEGPDDGDALLATLDALARATRDATADRVEAEAGIEAAERALGDARDAEAEARAALGRLMPYNAATPVLALGVDLAVPGPVAVTLRGRADAAWRPAYEAALDTEAEAATLDRRAVVTLSGAERWVDVDLRLSTASPVAANAPSAPMPDPARTEAPMLLEQAESASLARAMTAEDASVTAPEIRGLSVSYAVPDPVTLQPGAEAVLGLGALDLPTGMEIRAAPRTEGTAFIVATLTNPSPEPLPPGAVTLVRDGARIGETAWPLLAPGAETEMGFGALDTVRLTWARLERGEGDQGVFRRESTLRERVAFTVENTGGAARDVTALYPLPFSEQEDVTVDVDADPAPDRRDWEDRRGVAAWDLTLAPGETRRVELTFRIDWPEGEGLFWSP